MATLPQDTVRGVYLARLAESGIPEEAARAAKLKPLSAAQTASLWTGAPKHVSLKIPYLDPLGKDTGFYRIRVLGQLNGFDKQTERPLRYLQPPGSGVRAYFPTGVDWLPILADPNRDFIITEGEMKALAATLAGFPTIGLGGVDSWQSKARNEPFLEDLKHINWMERRVYICYDSDASLKPQVGVAARRLAEELGKYGARVYDAALPPLGTKKVGLDDFLLSRGAAALTTHLEHAPEFGTIKALHDFNSRFLLVRALSKVYEESTQHFYDAAKFVSVVEAAATYTITKLTDKGTRTEKHFVAKDWIAWPNRREVHDVSYLPGREDRIVQHDGHSRLNLWPGWGCTPKRGNVDLWTKLFNYLTRNESPDIRDWLEKWIAYPIQHPGAKLLTAVAVWGSAQGTGKTLLGETLIHIYGKNGQRIGQKQLSSAYNSWAQSKQFILGDEITGNDSRAYSDELKGLLTGNWIRINEKYMPEYDLPNCINFYFTSNHPDAFFVDDQDRRFLIIEAPDAPLPLSFYRDYDQWLKSPGGPAALFYHLKNKVDLRGFDPNAPPPRTLAHDIMVESSRSDIGRFVTLLLTDPEQAEAAYRVPKNVDLFTAKELIKYYDPREEKKVTEKAVGLELQKQGVLKVLQGAQIIAKGKGRVRVYALRNPEHWRAASPGKVKSYFEARGLVPNKF